MLPTNLKRRGRPRKTYDEIAITPEEYFRQFSGLSLADREKKSLEGVSRQEVTLIKTLFKLDYQTMARLINITKRSIHAHGPNEVFSPIISDRIMGLVELYHFGYFIFGEMDMLCEWMTCPNPRLHQIPPIAMLRTHSGMLEVRGLLTELLTGQY